MNPARKHTSATLASGWRSSRLASLSRSRMMNSTGVMPNSRLNTRKNVGAYALVGVEMIGDEIEEPFGKDSNDLPLTQMSNRIRANVHEILGVELHEDYRTLAEEPYSVVF